jgi:hypothetical protein
MLQCSDSTAAAPTVTTTTAGEMPAHAEYKMQTAAAADSSMLVTDLQPDKLYYARVSACTVLGYGARGRAIPDGHSAAGWGCRLPSVELAKAPGGSATATDLSIVGEELPESLDGTCEAVSPGMMLVRTIT